MTDSLLSKSNKLQFTEDLRSESPFSTPTERFQINPEHFGTFLTRTMSPFVRQLPFYESTALRYLYLQERSQEPLINYVPSDQVDYQVNLLLQSHFALRMRDSALALALPLLLRTMKINETRYEFAVKLLCVVHIADKFEPSPASLKLEQKILRLFGSASFKLRQEDLTNTEVALLQEIDYDINYITSYNFLNAFAEVADLDKEFTALALYLILACMCDVELYAQRPSIIAAACVGLAAKREYGDKWSNDMHFWTGYTYEMVLSVQHSIVALWRKLYSAAMQGKPSILFRAFLEQNYYGVSSIVPE